MEHNNTQETLENSKEAVSGAEADEESSVTSERTFSSSISFWEDWNVNKYADATLERFPGGRSPSLSFVDVKATPRETSPTCDSRNSSFKEFRKRERHAKTTDEAAPSFKTSWKISPEKPCRNFLILNSKLVPDEEKKCKEVTIPAEVASLVRELHTPKTEETQAVKSSIFANPPKCYKYGSFFRVHPDQWAVFWDPERVPELTTLTIQSFICAALNSRRRLVFVLGVATNSKIIGCEWTEETRQVMRKQFEFCVTREFVPALDEEIVRFRFYPVCDEEERNIPMLYIAVISIDDKVEEVYQLSSGRFYYANGKNVMQTSSISEVVKRITRHETRPLAIRQRPGAALRHVPYLGDPIEPDDSLVMWFFSRAVLYGFPAFLITLLSCKFLSKLFPH